MFRDTNDLDGIDSAVSQSQQVQACNNGGSERDGRVVGEQLLKTAEAAKELGVTQQTVRNWLKSGVLQGYGVEGARRSCLRITAASVKDVLSGKAWETNK